MKIKQLKIGVISDTHFRSMVQGAKLIDELCQHCFADVDTILHAGDMIHPDVALLFSGVPFYAVRGNNDPAVDGVPQYRVVEIGGYRIGLIHGWGYLGDLEKRMINHFSSAELDCLVYGHSHEPVCHEVEGLLVMNPGSAAQRRSAPWHSVGVLHLGDKISGEIINIDAT
ncbi:MAG: hypothetical protein B6I36_09215 [Desulfobacteraceae bacterium 4572_35.1]|nr:MAG: hypothetical protein B6I36_09215 [Desulfobacteraceae bacterium 4572_35.1]